MTGRILIDVTQLVRQPARSGIQRVVHELLRRWPGDVDARCVFSEVDDPTLHVVAIGDVAAALDGGFTVPGASPGVVSDRCRDAAEGTVNEAALAAGDQAVLLPEPSFLTDVVDRMRRLDHYGVPTMVLAYDALPVLTPWHYPRRDHLPVDAYFRWVAGHPHVACISATTKAQLARLRGGEDPSVTVCELGADGLADAPALSTGFVVVGTIERKKRIDVILDAFARVNRTRAVPLTLIGAPGNAEDIVAARLDDAPWLSWHADASDRVVAGHLRGATALVFMAEGEGFGIPPLEAMHAGCPVIAGPGVPSLEARPAGTYARVDADAGSLAAAVEAMCRPEVRAAFTRAIADCPLPTWEGFARDVAAWAVRGARRDADPGGSAA